jgi:hypothetical protein
MYVRRYAPTPKGHHDKRGGFVDAIAKALYPQVGLDTYMRVPRKIGGKCEFFSGEMS